MKKNIGLFGLFFVILSLILLGLGLLSSIKVIWIIGVIILAVSVVVSLVGAALASNNADRMSSELLSSSPRTNPFPQRSGASERLPQEGDGYR